MGFAVDFYNVPDRETPVDWAIAREGEGWECLGVGDHIVLDGRWALNAFACLGAMAGCTQRVRLAPMFANNMVRSPVEFAAFALTLQQLSGGRCEAGLGAGWSAGDAHAAGADMSDRASLARRYREAVTLVRELFRGGDTFHGEFYDVEDLGFAPVNDPPELFAAVGGAWGARHITPLVDRIEIFPAGPALRTSPPDLTAIAAVTKDDVRRLIDLASEANPAATIGVGMMVGAGDHPSVAGLHDLLRDSYCGRFYGAANAVAEALHELHDEPRIDRVGVLPGIPGTIDELAPVLFKS